MQKGLIFYRNRCTGCHYCEISCTLVHEGVCGPNGSRIRLFSEEKEMLHRAFFCRHCKQPICQELCPVDAISRSEENGMVKVDPEKCIGCWLCLGCPLGGMLANEKTGLAISCDLCGGDPTCVKFCAPGALKYVSIEKQVGAAKGKLLC